jgi:hypothetical protein
MAWPADYRRDAQATLQELGFPPGERPSIGIALVDLIEELAEMRLVPFVRALVGSH